MGQEGKASISQRVSARLPRGRECSKHTWTVCSLDCFSRFSSSLILDQAQILSVLPSEDHSLLSHALGHHSRHICTPLLNSSNSLPAAGGHTLLTFLTHFPDVIHVPKVQSVLAGLRECLRALRPGLLINHGLGQEERCSPVLPHLSLLIIFFLPGAPCPDNEENVSKLHCAAP